MNEEFGRVIVANSATVCLDVEFSSAVRSIYSMNIFSENWSSDKLITFSILARLEKCLDS